MQSGAQVKAKGRANHRGGFHQKYGSSLALRLSACLPLLCFVIEHAFLVCPASMLERSTSLSRAAATDKQRKGNEGKSDSFDGWTLLERRMPSSHTQRSSYLLPVSAFMESDVHVYAQSLAYGEVKFVPAR